jgi:hypothetical protein
MKSDYLDFQDGRKALGDIMVMTGSRSLRSVMVAPMGQHSGVSAYNLYTVAH